MKKRFFAILICILLTLTACGNDSKNIETIPPETTSIVIETTEPTISVSITENLVETTNEIDDLDLFVESPEQDTEPVEITVWIPTNGGKKYHSKSSCSNMKNPASVTIEEAENRGFTPCKRCF